MDETTGAAVASSEEPTSDVEVTRPERPDRGLLIEGGAVVTVDRDPAVGPFTIHDPGWVHVVDDRIAGVGPGPAPAEVRALAGHHIDATGRAVMPGMVNAHTHLFQTFFRGLADDKALLDWLRDCIWPGAVHLDATSARLAALLGLVENLRTGATSVIDHQYIHPADGGGAEAIDDAVCSAADGTGIRFLLARGWADRNYEPRLTESAATVLDRAERTRLRWHGHDGNRIRVELAPLIPWGCSDEAMIDTVAASRSWGAGTHVHCAETRVEVEMSLEERGVRHVPWLDGLGVLGPDTQLAHSVWLDDDELDLVAERGSVVVHCPVSNMYLASGVARVLEMRQRGIPVALASDGPGSNNRQDLFEAMKATVLLQKVNHLDPVALQPEDCLAMACLGGARALGQADQLGAIEVGRLADLVVVDLRSVFTAPVHRVASALVYTATPAHVSHVVVDGRIVIDDGRLTMLDEGRLLAAADAAARRVFASVDVASRLRSDRRPAPEPGPTRE
ncbi:MAG: amidohydrolase [Actinomycetota bacterium]